MTSLTLLSVTVLPSMVAVALLVLLFKLVSRRRPPSIDANWLTDFSTAKYRPMGRLLSEDDYKFLESQPGYHPALGAKLRKQRRAIFRGYLRWLAEDFHRLCGAIQSVMLISEQDRSDLAVVLVKQVCVFRYAMLAAHIRLMLHWAGMGAVDVRALVDSMEAMGSLLQERALVVAAVASR